MAKIDHYSGASPQAIQFHYDAGADFFRLWLGPSMTYTAGRFDPGETETLVPHGLDLAQKKKIRFHLEAAAVGPGSHILDIGCGWGGLMREAIKDHGAASAVGLTLSRDQRDYIHRDNAPGVSVYLQSYEHFQPQRQFDSIISVGAFEHFVKPTMSNNRKLATYSDFFELCHAWLMPHGKVSLQTIVWGDVAKGEESSIPVQQFFPDSDLPFIDEVLAASHSHFEILSFENRRRDYELTFRCWLVNLRSNKSEAIRLIGSQQYDFYDRCLQGGVRLFQRRKYYLCRFLFRRLGHR
jgi:cyclopropane-fatty-acyl-phospholipid synthase